MNLDSWKNAAEILGLAAIVASLVFVGLELRQSQEIAIGNQYQDRVALAVERTFENKRDEAYRTRQIGGFRARISSADIQDAHRQEIDDLPDEELAALYYFGLAQLNVCFRKADVRGLRPLPTPFPHFLGREPGLISTR